MTSSNGTATIGHIMETAARNFGRGGDLALAAGQIVVRRVALGFAAAIDPWRADHDEFHRMVPEKIEAFSAAGMIMLERSSRTGFTMTRLASDEVLTTASATMAMVGCADPLALAEAQSRYALAWFDQTASTMIAMGMLALHAHDAAMEPIRDAVRRQYSPAALTSLYQAVAVGCAGDDRPRLLNATSSASRKAKNASTP